MTDPYSPFQNRAKGEICEKVLWDYCLELSSKVYSVAAHNLYQLKGQVPETLMTGHTADISHLCEFSWYEWVMYNDEAGYPEDTEKLGQYLGPTEPGIGSVMSFIILQPSGRVVHRTTVQKLTPQQELEDKTHRQQTR
jgi:hypothetical protein